MRMREKVEFHFLLLEIWWIQKKYFFQINSLYFFTKVFRDWSLGCSELEDLKKVTFFEFTKSQIQKFHPHSHQSNIDGLPLMGPNFDYYHSFQPKMIPA